MRALGFGVDLVGSIPNPLINIIIQGRHDTYSKRRGMIRMPEMLAHGICVGWGQDELFWIIK